MAKSYVSFATYCSSWMKLKAYRGPENVLRCYSALVDNTFDAQEGSICSVGTGGEAAKL
jgi:hypothetical protein